MKKQVIILALFCILGQYTFGQISEGGMPISFSLDCGDINVQGVTTAPTIPN